MKDIVVGVIGFPNFLFPLSEFGLVRVNHLDCDVESFNVREYSWVELRRVAQSLEVGVVFDEDLSIQGAIEGGEESSGRGSSEGVVERVSDVEDGVQQFVWEGREEIHLEKGGGRLIRASREWKSVCIPFALL